MVSPLRNVFTASVLIASCAASQGNSDCCEEIPGGCTYVDQNTVPHELDCGAGSCCIGFFGGDEPFGPGFGDLAVMECCPPGTSCNFYSTPDGMMHVQCSLGGGPVNPGGLGD